MTPTPTRSVSEGDSTRDFPPPWLTLRVGVTGAAVSGVIGGGVSSGGTTSTTVTIAKAMSEARRRKRTAATNAGLVADVVSTERSVWQEAVFFSSR